MTGVADWQAPDSCTLSSLAPLTGTVGWREQVGWPGRLLSFIEVPALTNRLTCRPEIRRDYPLNLSISLSGGKETNKDSLSNGE